MLSLPRGQSRRTRRKGEARAVLYAYLLPNALQFLSFCERKVEDGRRASESRILSMELRFFPRHDSRKNFPATFRLPRQKQREGKQYEALCYERCNWTKCVKTFNELTA